MEGAYKAIESNPLHIARIQLKAYLPWSLVPLSYCSNSLEVFPDVQPESGFLSLEPIIPCPALWEDVRSYVCMQKTVSLGGGSETCSIQFYCFNPKRRGSIIES